MYEWIYIFCRQRGVDNAGRRRRLWAPIERPQRRYAFSLVLPLISIVCLVVLLPGWHARIDSVRCQANVYTSFRVQWRAAFAVAVARLAAPRQQASRQFAGPRGELNASHTKKESGKNHPRSLSNNWISFRVNTDMLAQLQISLGVCGVLFADLCCRTLLKCDHPSSVWPLREWTLCLRPSKSSALSFSYLWALFE